MEILLFVALFAIIGAYTLISRKIRSAHFYKKNAVCPQCTVPLVKTNVAVYGSDAQFGKAARREGTPNTPALRCPNCDYKIAMNR